MNYNKEECFITELLVSNDITTVIDSGITPKFLSGTNKEVLKVILDHNTNYGKLPNILTLKKKFPEFNFSRIKGKYGTNEPMKYWCDEIREKKKYNSLVDLFEESEELMIAHDTEKVLAKLKQTITMIENEVAESDRIYINSDTAQRYEDYKKRQATGGLTGLPIGIDMVDKITGGLNKGELTTYMAYTGVGKTWLLVIMAVNLVKLGYRVLLMTTEMSTKKMFQRIDAVWNGFDYTLFKNGQLTRKDEKKYRKYLDDMSKTSKDDMLLVVEQSTGGVTQIGAKIEQHKPDVVLVDGAYLLEDDFGNDDDWKSTVRIWRALHKLCLAKDLPVVVTTQSKDETNANLKSINFAKAIAQDCDVFGVLEQDEQQRRDREADIRYLKLRDGDTLSTVHINWNFNTMEYNSIYTEKVEAKEKPDLEEKGIITIE